MQLSQRLDDELELVLLERRHAPELYAVVDAHRAHLRRWLPWVDSCKSPEDSAAFIQTILDQLAAGRGFQTGIRYQGALVGMIGFHPIDHFRRLADIGYWLAESAQGRGIMTRSCRAYVTHAFEAFEVDRVQIRVAPGNDRSQAIPRRLGFEETGRLVEAEWLYDRHVDHVVYSMTAEAWQAATLA